MKRSKKVGWLAAVALTGLLFGIGGCGGGGGHSAPVVHPLAISADTSGQPITAADMPVAPITSAVSVIVPLSDSKVGGKVTFTQTADGVQVVADITGLNPGEHAMHIHEFGDLSDPKGMSAGGHYNPEGEMHGMPDSAHHHPGDMGNLMADKDGKAHLEILLHGVTIDGAKDPILGRAVIIHAQKDDGSQPVGNAGARVGGGVIGVAKPK